MSDSPEDLQIGGYDHPLDDLVVPAAQADAAVAKERGHSVIGVSYLMEQLYREPWDEHRFRAMLRTLDDADFQYLKLQLGGYFLLSDSQRAPRINYGVDKSSLTSKERVQMTCNAVKRTMFNVVGKWVAPEPAHPLDLDGMGLLIDQEHEWRLAKQRMS